VLYRGLPVDSTESLPVHPAQLYESLGALLLFGALLALRQRRTFRGEVFLAYVAGYGALRFLIEMLRDDPERGLYGPSGPPAIVWSLGCVALALAFAAGLSRSIAKRSIRAVTISATFLVALVVYGGLRTTTRGPTSLSTSQWIAILTSIAVAIACHVISTGSRAPGSGSKAGEGGESEGEDAGNANAEKPRSEAGFTGGTVSS
jgi:phosphatidylglycerol:prolipoprotein diacylglycerol transferase